MYQRAALVSGDLRDQCKNRQENWRGGIETRYPSQGASGRPRPAIQVGLACIGAIVFIYQTLDLRAQLLGDGGNDDSRNVRIALLHEFNNLLVGVDPGEFHQRHSICRV